MVLEDGRIPLFFGRTLSFVSTVNSSRSCSPILDLFLRDIPLSVPEWLIGLDRVSCLYCVDCRRLISAPGGGAAKIVERSTNRKVAILVSQGRVGDERYGTVKSIFCFNFSFRPRIDDFITEAGLRHWCCLYNLADALRSYGKGISGGQIAGLSATEVMGETKVLRKQA